MTRLREVTQIHGAEPEVVFHDKAIWISQEHGEGSDWEVVMFFRPDAFLRFAEQVAQVARHVAHQIPPEPVGQEAQR